MGQLCRSSTMLFVGAVCLLFAISDGAIQPTEPTSVPGLDQSAHPLENATFDSPRNIKEKLEKVENEISFLRNEIKSIQEQQLGESKKEIELLTIENKEAKIIELCAFQIRKGELNEAIKTFYTSNNTAAVLNQIIYQIRIKEDYENIVLFLSDLKVKDACNGFIILYNRIKNSSELCAIINLLRKLKSASERLEYSQVDDSDKQKLVKFLDDLPSSIRGIVWQEDLLISDEQSNKSLMTSKPSSAFATVFAVERNASLWRFEAGSEDCKFRIRSNVNQCTLIVGFGHAYFLVCESFNTHSGAAGWVLKDHNWRADLYILQNRNWTIDVSSRKFVEMTEKQNVVKIHRDKQIGHPTLTP